MSDPGNYCADGRFPHRAGVGTKGVGGEVPPQNRNQRVWARGRGGGGGREKSTPPLLLLVRRGDSRCFHRTPEQNREDEAGDPQQPSEQGQGHRLQGENGTIKSSFKGPKYANGTYFGAWSL